MPQAAIEGAISATGYLHIKYGMQVIDGTRHSPYDIVVRPNDERGSVAFALPQGLNVTIEVYTRENDSMVMNRVVTIPRSEKVALSELLN